MALDIRSEKAVNKVLDATRTKQITVGVKQVKGNMTISFYSIDDSDIPFAKISLKNFVTKRGPKRKPKPIVLPVTSKKIVKKVAKKK